MRYTIYVSLKNPGSVNLMVPLGKKEWKRMRTFGGNVRRESIRRVLLKKFLPNLRGGDCSWHAPSDRMQR